MILLFFSVLALMGFLYFYRNNGKLIAYLMLGIMIILMTQEIQLQIIGMDLRQLYNSGTGVVYRQQVLNISDNSTYSVDHAYMDMGDDRIGYYLTMQQLDYDMQPVINLCIAGCLMILGILFFKFVLEKLNLMTGGRE